MCDHLPFGNHQFCRCFCHLRLAALSSLRSSQTGCSWRQSLEWKRRHCASRRWQMEGWSPDQICDDLCAIMAKYFPRCIKSGSRSRQLYTVVACCCQTLAAVCLNHLDIIEIDATRDYFVPSSHGVRWICSSALCRIPGRHSLTRDCHKAMMIDSECWVLRDELGTILTHSHHLACFTGYWWVLYLFEAVIPSCRCLVGNGEMIHNKY